LPLFENSIRRIEFQWFLAKVSPAIEEAGFKFQNQDNRKLKLGHIARRWVSALPETNDRVLANLNTAGVDYRGGRPGFSKESLR